MSGSPPDDAALVLWNDHGHLLDTFLGDVGDALQQVAVAGLSFPDPELPDELVVLGGRARQLGLSRGALHLQGLSDALAAVARAGDDDRDARHEALAEAWRQSQWLTAWWRLSRVEYDLRTVQARLALDRRRALGPEAGVRATVPTRSLTVRPVGMELDPAGRLLVFATVFGDDRPTGVRSVILRDQLSEFDRDAPLAGPVISRLFQDAVPLVRLLDGVVRLEDHPVTERGDGWLFRPAFRAVPRILPLAAGVPEEALPWLDLRRLRAGVHPAVPCRVTVTVRWDPAASPRVVAVLDDGEPAPFAPAPALWLSLAKRLIARGAREDGLDLAVLPRGESLLVLHHLDGLDTRRYLAHEPGCLNLDAAAVARWLLEAAVDDPGEAVFVRGVAALAGGAAVDRAAVREAWEAHRPAGVAAGWRARWCGWILGSLGDPAEARGWLHDLAACVGPVEPDLGALGRLLGRDPSQVSAADAGRVDDALVFRVVWMALGAGLGDEEEAAFAAVESARFAGPLGVVTVAGVCGRALLQARASLGDPEAAACEAAREYLQGHRAAMIVEGRAPLLDAMELVHLGDTLVWLRGGDRRGPVAAGLGIDRVGLALRCAEAVGTWRLEGDEGRAVRAAEALFLAALGGVLGWVVG